MESSYPKSLLQAYPMLTLICQVAKRVKQPSNEQNLSLAYQCTMYFCCGVVVLGIFTFIFNFLLPKPLIRSINAFQGRLAVTNLAQNPVVLEMYYIRPKISNSKLQLLKKINTKLTQSFCMAYSFQIVPTIFQVRLTNHL